MGRFKLQKEMGRRLCCKKKNIKEKCLSSDEILVYYYKLLKRWAVMCHYK